MNNEQKSKKGDFRVQRHMFLCSLVVLAIEISNCYGGRHNVTHHCCMVEHECYLSYRFDLFFTRGKYPDNKGKIHLMKGGGYRQAPHPVHMG